MNFSKSFRIFPKLFENSKKLLKIQKFFEKFKKISWKIPKFFLKNSKFFFKIQKFFFWKIQIFFWKFKTCLKFPKHVFLRFRAGTNYLRYAQNWGTRLMEYEKPVLRSLKRNTLLWRYLNTWLKLIDLRNMSDKL